MGGRKKAAGAEDAKYIYIGVVDGALVEVVVLAPVCSPSDIPK